MSAPAGRSIRAVLFDLGNTLVLRRDFNHVEELARRVGLEVEGEALAHSYTEVEAEFDRAGRPFTLSGFWSEVVRSAASDAPSPDRMAAFVQALSEEPPWGEVYSDVGLCFDELSRAGIAIGVLADRIDERSARELLARAGLTGRIRAIVSAETEGIAKPAAEIFRRAVERLGVPPGAALYVGDLPNLDVRAARAAGLPALWLHRDGTGFGDDPPEITSLAELPGWIAGAQRIAGRSR